MKSLVRAGCLLVAAVSCLLATFAEVSLPAGPALARDPGAAGSGQDFSPAPGGPPDTPLSARTPEATPALPAPYGIGTPGPLSPMGQGGPGTGTDSTPGGSGTGSRTPGEGALPPDEDRPGAASGP